MNTFNPRAEDWSGWYESNEGTRTLYRHGDWHVFVQGGTMEIWNEEIHHDDDSIYEGDELPHDEVVRFLLEAGYRPEVNE